jgi:hypothetical protein
VAPIDTDETLLEKSGLISNKSKTELAAPRKMREKRGLYAGAFERDGRALKVRVDGQLAFNGTYQC